MYKSKDTKIIFARPTDLFFRWAVFKSLYWIKKIVEKSRLFLNFEKENDFTEYLL